MYLPFSSYEPKLSCSNIFHWNNINATLVQSKKLIRVHKKWNRKRNDSSLKELPSNFMHNRIERLTVFNIQSYEMGLLIRTSFFVWGWGRRWGLGRKPSYSVCSVNIAIARAALFAARARRPHPVNVAAGTQPVAVDAAAGERRAGAIVRRRVLLVRAVVSAARVTARCRAPVHIEF